MSTTRSIPNDEQTGQTARGLLGGVESAAFIIQALQFGVTILVDKLTTDGRLLLGIIGVGHLLLAWAAHRWGGPIRRGGVFILMWLGLSVLMPLVMAHLLAPREYGASPTCVQLCSYQVPAAVIFAFYPWLAVGAHIYRKLGLAVLAVIVFEPLFIMLVINKQLSTSNWLSFVTSGVTAVIGYIFGAAIGSMCRRATAQQLEQRERMHEEHYDFLHAHAKACMAALRPGLDEEQLQIVDHFERVISRDRHDEIFAREHVPLEGIFADQIRLFERRISIAPRMAHITASPTSAKLIDNALGNLLSNAVKHANASRIEIHFEVDGQTAQLDVVDDGAGFSDHAFDNRESNLGGLRNAARELGGDLARIAEPSGGSRLRLTIPLYVELLASRAGR